MRLEAHVIQRPRGRPAQSEYLVRIQTKHSHVIDVRLVGVGMLSVQQTTCNMTLKPALRRQLFHLMNVFLHCFLREEKAPRETHRSHSHARVQQGVAVHGSSLALENVHVAGLARFGGENSIRSPLIPSR